MSPKVLVTGAGGRTGGLVVQRLMKRPTQFEAIATVRNAESKAALSAKLNLSEASIRLVDLSLPEETLRKSLLEAMQGVSAVVIATSAVPEVIPAPAGAPPGPPSFKWKGDQAPEQLDWIGQKAQVDAAQEAGVKHVVLVSSMGGTNPEHPLNRIAGGKILQWKRKAEQYLKKQAEESGGKLSFTIIHPGGLLDQEGSIRQLLVDVDDVLSQGTNRSLPRDDVAEVCVQSLILDKYKNRAFDLASMPPGEGTVTTDFDALIETLGGRNCDYSLNSQW